MEVAISQVREATAEFLGLSGEKPNLSGEKLDSSSEKLDPPVETKDITFYSPRKAPT